MESDRLRLFNVDFAEGESRQTVGSPEQLVLTPAIAIKISDLFAHRSFSQFQYKRFPFNAAGENHVRLAIQSKLIAERLVPINRLVELQRNRISLGIGPAGRQQIRRCHRP